jgi:predicted dehydrogenase
MPTLRAGVIGAGVMGAHHARAYATLAGAELVGVHDPDAGRAADVSERYGARPYPDLGALLDAVDVVTVASPSHLHVEHALLALEHGCDVLVEKPVALSADSARTLQRAVARDPRGPVVAAGHIERFNPAVRELRKLLAGRHVIGVDCRRLGPASERNRDIDVVQDLMLHDLDIVLGLLPARPAQVQAAGVVTPGSDLVEYAVATVVFAEGTVATFGASRATEERVRRMSVSAVESHVTVDLASRAIETCRSTNLAEAVGAGYRQESIVERIHVPNEEPLLVQAASFIEACRRREPPEVGIDAAVRCLEVVDAVRAAVARVPEALAAAS